MGTAKSKLLLPYRDRTVLEYAVAAALESGAGLTVVVLGHEAEAVRQALAGAYPGRADLRLVLNPDYRAGQASSLRVGLRAVLDAAPSSGPVAAAAGNVPQPALPRAVVFGLGDQPLVTAGTITALIDAYLASPAGCRPMVVAPIHGGRRGNPVLIDRRLFPELLALTGDTGARAVLQRRSGEGTLLIPAGPEVLFDLDTVEDYACLGRRSAPEPDRAGEA
jgi:molybdenum cofactor cytidylyltransferase